mgnify:CR=1 FL=1|jgi:hypothetical protein
MRLSSFRFLSLAFTAGLFIVPLLSLPARPQQVVPTSNGFSIGTSSGRTSFYRQESRSESNALLQQIKTNVSPAALDAKNNPTYTITNPLEAFNLVNERQTQSAGDSTTSIGGAAFTGFSFSVFAQ